MEYGTKISCKHQWKTDDNGAKYCVNCDLRYHEVLEDEIIQKDKRIEGLEAELKRSTQGIVDVRTQYKSVVDMYNNKIGQMEANELRMQRTMEDIKRTAEEAGHCFDGCREAVSMIIGLSKYALFNPSSQDEKLGGAE